MIRHMNKGFFAFFFMVILVLAAFSLVLTDWTGSFRAGTGNGNIATMKGDKITVPEFTALVSRVARAENINPADAYDRGLVMQILSSEMWQKLLAVNAQGLGVRVDDATLIARLKEMATPIAAQEKTNVADVMKRYIVNQGLTEAAFLDMMRRDMANDMLRRVVSAVSTPSDFVRDDMIAFGGQVRDVQYFVMQDPDVDVPTPTADQIKQYYTERQNDFMLPERRDIQWAVIKRSTFEKDLKIDDQSISDYYEAHQKDLIQNEKRVVQFAVFPNDKEAQAGFDVLKSAQDFKKTAHQKFPKIAVDQTDFEKSETMPDYLKPAFAAKVGDIVGPVQTPLGVYVMRVASMTPAGKMTLDHARPIIEKTLRDGAISARTDKVLDDINDAVDRGDAINVVAKNVGVDVVTMLGVARDGTADNGDDLMKDHASIKASVLTSAFTGDDLARVRAPIELSNGDICIVAVSSIAPPHPKPFDEVKGKLIADYMTMKRRESNIVKAQGMMTDWISGKTSLGKMAQIRGIQLQTLSDIRRDQKELPGSMDRVAWGRFFAMPASAPIMEPIPGGVMMAMVQSVRLADPAGAAKDVRDQTVQSLTKMQGEEQIAGYMGALSDRYNPRVNDALIKRLFNRSKNDGE